MASKNGCFLNENLVMLVNYEMSITSRRLVFLKATDVFQLSGWCRMFRNQD